MPAPSPSAQLEAALALHQAGHLDAAKTGYLELLRRFPQQPDALHLLGMAEAGLGHPAEGIARIREALRLQPNFPGAWFNLGNLLQRQGEIGEAMVALQRAVRQNPDNPDFLCNLGNCHLLGGTPDHAAGLFEEALALAPKNPVLHHNLGRAWMQQGRLQEAAQSMAEAIDLQPDFPKAWEDISGVLRSLNRYQDSIDAHLQALEFNPQNAALWCNLGECYFETGQFENAEECLSNALEIDGRSVPALCNLGNVHRHFSRFEEAILCYQRALRVDPGCAEALGNLGCTHLALGRFQEAEQGFRSLLAAHPHHSSAEWNLAVTLLAAGDFQRAWPAYEVRWRSPHMAPDLRNYPQPLWLGETMPEGRSVLVHPEQGLGDCLQFVRYATALAGLNCQVHLEAPPPLFPLLKNLPGITSVFPSGAPVPAFDLHCPLLSLPLALSRLAPETDVKPPPYLGPDAASLEAWRVRMAPWTGPKIGIVWSGNAKHQNDAHRSPGFGKFAPFLDLKGLHFIRLQTEVRDSDREAVLGESRMLQFTEHQTDFLQTAALVAQLDLVISCDTALAHLAGAMGKPVWILLPSDADWRWRRETDHTPWYPSARLFRQTVPGDWAPVFHRVIAALVERFTDGAQ
jgi:tetratricopeptide (TPR) repeat protein